ncbi:MAG: PAS domain S-box protein [Pseudomonadota bacterium]
MLIQESSNRSESRTAGQWDGALLRALVDDAVDGIVAIDEQGVVQLFNPAAEHMFGYRADEILGQNITRLMPEPYRSEHGRYLHNYLDSGQKKIIGIGREVSGRRKDGSTFPMYLSVSEMRRGKRRLFAGIVQDLTARKQTENILWALAGSTALPTEDEFIRACVRDLANTYGARYAFAGVFADEAKASIRTLAVWTEDGFADDFEYDLAGTPCRDILECNIEIVASDASRRYPLDPLLAEMGVESYFGAPMVSTSGTTMGLVSVMDTKPMQPNAWTRPVLGIFAKRMALELERKWAEERLRRSEEQLRLTLENAPIGIATVGLEGRLLSVNPAFCAILGYSADELLGMTVADITHPDDIEEALAHRRALIQGDIASCELEERYIRRDGALITVCAHAGLVRDADGAPMLIVGEFEDITERKRAAQEMQRMRAYLENMINSMPSILVGVDVQGRITEWNRSAEAAKGMPVSEAVGRGFAELFPELESQLDKVHEAVHRRVPVRTERFLTESGGELRYADVMVYPLLANGVVGAVIRVDDITNRVRMEQMMVQTEKMMSVGGLAAGMAHEINNPLSGVLQSCQNIRRRLSSELSANRDLAESLGLDLDIVHRYLEQRGVLGFIEGIREAGMRASRIVADMLSFSRGSTQELVPARVDEMLETVLRLAASDYDLKKKYDFKQVQILRDYDPALEPVLCDRTEIEQVFLNLIKNAAQAMADGGSPPYRMTLCTRREGDYACIEVQDNGPGMDEPTRRRVFEPFFTTKPAGVGTGLGLSVSYFIVVEQHQGSINVSSVPGQGTRFVVRLPLKRGPA